MPAEAAEANRPRKRRERQRGSDSLHRIFCLRARTEQSVADDGHAIGQVGSEIGGHGGQSIAELVDCDRAEALAPAVLDFREQRLPDLASHAAGGGADDPVGLGWLGPRIAGVRLEKDATPSLHAVEIGLGARAAAQFTQRN